MPCPHGMHRHGGSLGSAVDRPPALLTAFYLTFMLTTEAYGGYVVTQAVQASLTALSGSMAGVQGKEVDSAVDFVFDTVFNRDFLTNFINEDEYI